MSLSDKACEMNVEKLAEYIDSATTEVQVSQVLAELQSADDGIDYDDLAHEIADGLTDHNQRDLLDWVSGDDKAIPYIDEAMQDLEPNNFLYVLKLGQFLQYRAIVAEVIDKLIADDIPQDVAVIAKYTESGYPMNSLQEMENMVLPFETENVWVSSEGSGRYMIYEIGGVYLNEVCSYHEHEGEEYLVEIANTA